MTINTQNWRQLSAIQIGGVICMPVLMIGQTLNELHGFNSALLAVFLGNALLFGLALIAAKMSYEGGKTTMENAIDYFGKKGVTFFSIAMTLSLIGWFAIQLNMMTLGVVDLFGIDPSNTMISTLLNIALGILITAVALYGVKGITILANLSLPLLLATLAYAFYSTGAIAAPVEAPITYGGVSIVIAMAIACVIDLPTYFRHAKTAKDSYISVFLIFAVTIPLLEALGIYLAASSDHGSFLDIFKRNNSAIWNIWTAAFLILAGWTTNNTNLYSGVACMETLAKKSSEILRTVLFGILGTLLACMDLLNHLDLFLETIGILISSMGGVILTRFLITLFTRRPLSIQDHRTHLIAWTVGILAGCLGWYGVSLTTISVLDATIGASLGTCVIMFRRREYEAAYSR